MQRRGEVNTQYLKQPIKLTRASMPHPNDGEIVQNMRMVNIAEIGSNTREFREIGDLVFEADLEEKNEAEKIALGSLCDRAGSFVRVSRKESKCSLPDGYIE